LSAFRYDCRFLAISSSRIPLQNSIRCLYKITNKILLYINNIMLAAKIHLVFMFKDTFRQSTLIFPYASPSNSMEMRVPSQGRPKLDALPKYIYQIPIYPTPISPQSISSYIQEAIKPSHLALTHSSAPSTHNNKPQPPTASRLQKSKGPANSTAPPGPESHHHRAHPPTPQTQ